MIDRIKSAQDKTISKRNETREEYEENRQVGFIKNYTNLRHKEQSKFRRHKLTNIHTSNIKRPFKFPENISNMILILLLQRVEITYNDNNINNEKTFFTDTNNTNNSNCNDQTNTNTLGN